MTRSNQWSVADTEDTYTDDKGNVRYRVIFRCATEDEAVLFLETQNPAKVARGDFELCGHSGDDE